MLSVHSHGDSISVLEEVADDVLSEDHSHSSVSEKDDDTNDVDDFSYTEVYDYLTNKQYKGMSQLIHHDDYNTECSLHAS